MLFSKQDALVLVAHPHQLRDAFADEVEHLADAHEDAQGAGHHHEKHKDLLLSWAANEAVNSVGTRFQGAFGQSTREESKILNFKRYSHWLFLFRTGFSLLTWAGHSRDISGTGCRESQHQSRP